MSTSPANKQTTTPSHEEDGARVTPFPPRMQPAPTSPGGDAASGPLGRLASKAALGALVAVIAAVLAWLLLRDPAAPAAVAAPEAPLELAAVDVVTVEKRILARSMPLSGSMSPIVQATVKAKVGGEVELVTVREGQDVQEGQVIASIDARNLQAQYERELAAVEKAQADLNLATLNRDKNRVLLEQRYISQNTYESAQSTYDGNLANLKLAQAQARLAHINLQDARIRAPFTGTLARRLVEPGEKVSPDSPIVTVVDLRQMVLEAAVPAADIPAVRLGQKASFRVDGFGARQFTGEVQRINPVTTDGTRAIAIYIAVPNPDRALKGGMFAQGGLALQTSEPVLAVDQRAVREESGAYHVYSLREGRITRTPVTLGPTVEGSSYVEVRDGLADGDKVIVTDIAAAQVGRGAIVREAGTRPAATRNGLANAQ
jgi:membrane fusion protein, multidrug efflux system